MARTAKACIRQAERTQDTGVRILATARIACAILAEHTTLAASIATLVFSAKGGGGGVSE